ncbi:MAG TPA: radical SAM protein [Candidatus Anoxymicrobiaceae bacterium]
MDQDHNKAPGVWRARLALTSRRLLEGRAGDALMLTAIRMLYEERLRRIALGASRALLPFIVKAAPDAGGRADPERLAFARAILDTCGRRVPEGALPRRFLELAGAMVTRPCHTAGDRPWLVAIAPTKACNLSCRHCYASSSDGSGSSMPYDELDRIVTDAESRWGVRAIVLTGGEPFLYRSGGGGIIDLIERHDHLMFLVFTNGTLIDAPLARRLARAGNAAVAVSVEGMKGATDARRGPGAFEGAVRALSCLRDAGALSGISMTATRRNCEELFSEELLDFFFVDNAASFGFVFQYMPEGRDADPGLMPTPQQRLWLWERSWQVVRDRGLVLFDFWNHGSLLGGCIAAGRERGYLYVDWDGNVLPCVFAPFTDCNLKEVYARGGGLEDAWASPLLASVRDWQRAHSSESGAVISSRGGGGLMCACPVRDHYADFAEMVLATGAGPADAVTGSCMASQDYRRMMVEHGRGLAELVGAPDR